MTFPNLEASKDQIDYLSSYFDSVRTTFSYKATPGSLSKVSARQILHSLQQIQQTLESTGFEELAPKTET